MAPHPRSRTVVCWTTRFSVVLVGLALVGELVVRNFVHAPPERSLDPDFGPGPRPHSLVIESREGFARHRIDSAGRFDRSLSTPVDRRVLLLGDSFSVGQQVAHGERFSERVEEALEGVEVVNHAAPGWYPPYYTAWIRSHDVSRYDAVVIQLSEGDLFELHRPDRVSVEREGDDGWELVMKGFPVRPSRLQQWSRWLSARSALYDFTRQRIRLLAEQERSRLASRLGGSDARAATVGASSRKVPEDAVDVLTALDHMAREHHDTIVYLYVPRPTYDRAGHVLEWPEARAAFQEFARRSGAVFVDPTDRIQAAFERTGRPLHGFHNSVIGEGHLNSLGHRVVGDALADELAGILTSTEQPSSEAMKR